MMMNNIRLSLLLSGLLGALTAQASGPQVSPVAWLLTQIRTGESINKYDLVQQSLYRLEKIDPENPQVLAARLRVSLHQGDLTQAQSLMAQLRHVAPDSEAARESAAGLKMMSGEGRQKLQEARLLAASGRLAEAKAAYDAQFAGIFPDVSMALEYWRLVARLPSNEMTAYQQLQALEKRYPGNISVELQLARMAFEHQQPAEAVTQLRRLANINEGRVAAAELWLTQIRNQPVSDSSVAALQHYLSLFNSGDEQRQGEEELTRQQTLLADPAYRQRVRGLALVEAGGGANAIPSLTAAIKAHPDDAELLGAMGQAQARVNHRASAISWLERAVKAGQQSTQLGKWQSLLQTNRYWLAIENGDQALAKKDIDRAEQYYRTAQTLDDRDSYALIGLGDVALARKNSQKAEQLWQQALTRDRSNITTIRRLIGLYQSESPARALQFMSSLPAVQQPALAETLRDLHSDTLRAEGDALAQQTHWAQAAVKYQQAAQLTPNDVWLNYRLAGALHNGGEKKQGDGIMHALLNHHPDDVTAHYAAALYLSSHDDGDAALSTMHRLPSAKWDDNMRALAARLMQDKLLAEARALREKGQEEAATALLLQQPVSTRRDMLLADWALERGDARQALDTYQKVLIKEPDNSDARLGRIDALIALKHKSEAYKALQKLPSTERQTSNSERRIALAWQQVGETTRAQQLLQALKLRVASDPPSPDKALIYRDAARVELTQQQSTAALNDYRDAMVASGITATRPENSESLTALTRNELQDDWLKRSIRRDAADLYRQQETTLTLEQDYSRNKGSGGLSDFTAHTTLLQADTPLAAGRTFVRLDHVQLSAGSFAHANGTHDALFGSCNDANSGGCSRDFTQRDEGTAVGIGWKSDRWSADVGTTPLGFAVTNWVGGISWKTDLKEVGIVINASRRPISSSLLAFAGTRDPSAQGGKTVGGVVATGGGMGLSYDRGGAQGIWGDVSAHQISGENVADNSRERVMGGYYYKLINEDNRRATVGLNSMLWHYQKDLSGYSFGQGGYYSPQRYLSFSLPVSWRQRMENWSYELGGSASWSQSHRDAQRRYPLNPGFMLASNPLSESSTSRGIGYTLQALLERRVTANWFIGAGIDIQQAEDYTPSHGLIYLRYSAAGWQGDLAMPPQALVPYADFK